MRDAIMGLSDKPHEERVGEKSETCDGLPNPVIAKEGAKPMKYGGSYADVVRNKMKKVSFSETKDDG